MLNSCHFTIYYNLFSLFRTTEIIQQCIHWEKRLEGGGVNFRVLDSEFLSFKLRGLVYTHNHQIIISIWNLKRQNKMAEALWDMDP